MMSIHRLEFVHRLDLGKLMLVQVESTLTKAAYKRYIYLLRALEFAPKTYKKASKYM